MYGITPMWNLKKKKKANSEKQTIRSWLPGAGGGGNGKILVKGEKLPVTRLTSCGYLMHSV